MKTCTPFLVRFYKLKQDLGSFFRAILKEIKSFFNT